MVREGEIRQVVVPRNSLSPSDQAALRPKKVHKGNKWISTGPDAFFWQLVEDQSEHKPMKIGRAHV